MWSEMGEARLARPAGSPVGGQWQPLRWESHACEENGRPPGQ